MLDKRLTQPTVPGTPDDLDRILEEQLEDPDFRSTYEDAEVRSALIQFFAQLRKQRGWSQIDLAKKLRTTQSAVSDFEKSVVEPRLPTLQRWARAFGFRLDLQLWEGPLVRYNSWIQRKLPYESVVRAVQVDDEIARSWFEMSTFSEADAQSAVSQKPTFVSTEEMHFDAHYSEPIETDNDFWRDLTMQLRTGDDTVAIR